MAEILIKGMEMPTFRVMLRNGYSSRSPYLVAKVLLAIGEGKPEWGAEKGKEYYVLRIKEIENVFIGREK